MKKTLCFIPMAAMLFAACSTTQNLGSPNEFKEFQMILFRSQLLQALKKSFSKMKPMKTIF